MVRQGKSLQDAREGGCSGCIEVGAFGKEAYLLTGYLNVPKILEVTLNNGVDPVGGKQVGLKTGEAANFKSFDELYDAFIKQLNYITDLKIRVSNYIDRMFAKYAPATFLSVVIEDCIKKGKDYYNGGPRYNTNYIQCTGLGTVTDSLAAIKWHVFERQTVTMERLLTAVANNFSGEEILRQRIINKTPFFGNDNDYADSIAVRVYEDLFKAIEGQAKHKGGEFPSQYALNNLPRLFWQGYRSNSQRPPCRSVNIRRHLPFTGGRYPWPYGCDKISGQTGPDKIRRNIAKTSGSFHHW